MNQLKQQSKHHQLNNHNTQLKNSKNQSQSHNEFDQSQSIAENQDHSNQNQNSNPNHNQSNNQPQPYQQNEVTPQASLEVIKQQSMSQKDTQRKKRRKKIDSEGRDYSCSCGKSYLSYPALYTHVKTKHNGEISITQNLRLPFGQSLTSQQNVNHSQQKPPVVIKQDPDEDNLPIEKIRELIYKQFIKDRSKEALVEFRNSLKLSEEEKSYVGQIMRQEGYNENVKVEECGEGMITRYWTSARAEANGINATNNNNNTQNNTSNDHLIPSSSQSNLLSISSHLHNNTPSSHRQDPFLTTQQPFNTFSPQHKKFQRIHVIRTVMLEKNHTQNRPAKPSDRKGFVSCIFPTELNKRQSNVSKSDSSSIDQVMGGFLSEFFRSVVSNELINMAVAYFVCKIKHYFDRNVKGVSSNERNSESLIEESNSLTSYLIQIDNQYIRQSIVVCKLLFFFYRWMYKQQFTQKFVKFNQAG